MLSQILLPLALTASIAAGSLAGTHRAGADRAEADLGGVEVSRGRTGSLDPADLQTLEALLTSPLCDTVIYSTPGYKARRKGDFDQIKIADSLLVGTNVGSFEDEETDSVRISARDTLIPPDSLQFTDPFRFKYYAALLDSAVHAETMDSLKTVFDSLKTVYDTLKARGSEEDSLTLVWDAAVLDSLEMVQLDSTYLADLKAREEAAFLAWYASLTPEERKKYDKEQRDKAKRARADSLEAVKAAKRIERDSIIENTPRILSTYVLPDSMHFKRLVKWQTEQESHKVHATLPDTSYNFYFHDFAFQREDVNSSWLGTAGSPVQYYNYFKREGDEDVEFYRALEPWSFSPSTLWQYNSKTPHTELAYWGTLLAGTDKESDNIHLFTTQNVTPSLNFSVLFDRWGSEGILINERSVNKTFAPAVNYIGKKYSVGAGYISNTVIHNENGGIEDIYWIRDTLVDPREIPVVNTVAQSNTTKRTVFLDQELRLPFSFIEDWKHRGDTLYVKDTTGRIDRDITTLFIGHSSEYSKYRRTYTDSPKDATIDSMDVSRLDNKVYLKFQPTSEDALLSAVSGGIGSRIRTYFDSTSLRPMAHKESDLYAYAGAEGNYSKYFNWRADARYIFAGDNSGDFRLGGEAVMSLYPFRKARTSPLRVSVSAETRLEEPNYYQKVLNLGKYSWENDFTKISSTQFKAALEIPYWGLWFEAYYGLMKGNTYYNPEGMIMQNPDAMSVGALMLRKDFTLFDFLHLENRLLAQTSSNPDVVQVPALAGNLRYYIQFPVKKNVLTMQVGADMWWNTKWYSPSWNPNLGVFTNQSTTLYSNGPIIDAFINMQWKKACIFIKYENAGRGWPLDRPDYFSADRYVVTQSSVKFGIFWPFFVQPAKDDRPVKSSGSKSGRGDSSGSSSGPGPMSSVPGGQSLRQ